MRTLFLNAAMYRVKPTPKNSAKNRIGIKNPEHLKFQFERLFPNSQKREIFYTNISKRLQKSLKPPSFLSILFKISACDQKLTVLILPRSLHAVIYAGYFG